MHLCICAFVHLPICSGCAIKDLQRGRTNDSVVHSIEMDLMEESKDMFEIVACS